jgi:hypothetical protein
MIPISITGISITLLCVVHLRLFIAMVNKFTCGKDDALVENAGIKNGITIYPGLLF